MIEQYPLKREAGSERQGQSQPLQQSTQKKTVSLSRMTKVISRLYSSNLVLQPSLHRHVAKGQLPRYYRKVEKVAEG
jgi:hypothetical protein